MTYEKALEYIHGVSNFFCKPGLSRIEELCGALGHPERELKFIHVAGTNGKGSVCSMLSSVMRAAGMRVGLFTSPYVREFNERMRINGQNIPNERLAELTERVRYFADRMEDRPTEFELITAIGFLYFFEEKCDVVVLEVGMGGRLDATNIIPPPLLSVITGISIDHTAFLGSTTREIAGEKAGIIKENAPVLWGGSDPEAETVIGEKAEKMQTRLYKTDYSKLKITAFDLSGTRFSYKEREDIEISLLGGYQPNNAAIALEAIDILKESGIEISEEAVRLGLLSARWPARFEIISREPLIIFDGGHNPEGIDAAKESIKRYFPKTGCIVLSGVLSDKDYRHIARSITDIAKRVYTITPENPRALSAEDYADCIRSLGCDATSCRSVAEAFSLAREDALEKSCPLICLGSLYTYCEILREME